MRCRSQFFSLYLFLDFYTGHFVLCVWCLLMAFLSVTPAGQIRFKGKVLQSNGVADWKASLDVAGACLTAYFASFVYHNSLANKQM